MNQCNNSVMPTSLIRKVLITGGAGFIGVNLIDYFIKETPFLIVILDNLSVGNKQYVDRITLSEKNKDRIKFVVGDIRNKDVVEDASKDVDAIIHLAAFTGVFSSLNDPRETFDINVCGTFNLLEACRKFEINRFVFASSGAAVGEQEPPIDERKVPLPISPYGASKLAGEALCSAYYQSYGIKAVSLRFANAYGPYSFHKTSVIRVFIGKAKEGKPLIIYGDGTQTRDFIYVKDICRAIHLSMQYEPDHSNNEGLVFQIASGIEVKILDLALLIQKLATQDGQVLPPIKFDSVRIGEVKKVYANIDKAKRLLSFRATIPFNEGIRITWENLCNSR